MGAFAVSHQDDALPVLTDARTEGDQKANYAARGEKCDVLGREGEAPCERSRVGGGSAGASPSQGRRRQCPHRAVCQLWRIAGAWCRSFLGTGCWQPRIDWLEYSLNSGDRWPERQWAWHGSRNPTTVTHLMASQGRHARVDFRPRDMVGFWAELGSKAGVSVSGPFPGVHRGTEQAWFHPATENTPGSCLKRIARIASRFVAERRMAPKRWSISRSLAISS
jgi:hypothetical protein